ncbi:hypothetical protein HHI36_012233 [Cryptolaemus montrouzieri]|uniref:UPAR/Ly6 domain-containing protein n=1 Tax=Cryptolaemus montrouzieri TaxID=559131 RepID=A0ABD2NDY2_9CUCU
MMNKSLFILVLCILVKVHIIEALQCLTCESSTPSQCKEASGNVIQEVCSKGMDACVTFGVNNPNNKDKPQIFIRKCAKDSTICKNIKNIYQNNVLGCNACSLSLCNKNKIE